MDRKIAILLCFVLLMVNGMSNVQATLWTTWSVPKWGEKNSNKYQAFREDIGELLDAELHLQ
uniref:Uncharacterized protein n=1 Tax=Ciona savignyi TaxID=51511 RepID=H2YIU2_CIOSA